MAKVGEEHGGVRRLADKARDAVAGKLGKAHAAGRGSSDDFEFIQNAAIGDMYEIAAAKVALKHARSPAIKEMAHRMMIDHTTSTHQLRSALQMIETDFGTEDLPTAVDHRRRTMLEHLQTAPADKFDETYLDQQVLAHEETLTLLTAYRDDEGGNPQLRSYAAGAAPVVERHLERMKALKNERPA